MADLLDILDKPVSQWG